MDKKISCMKNFYFIVNCEYWLFLAWGEDAFGYQFILICHITRWLCSHLKKEWRDLQGPDRTLVTENENS